MGVDSGGRGFWWTWILVDVDSSGRGFWWTWILVDVDSGGASEFTCRVFHRDVPAVTGPVPLQFGRT